MPGNTNSFQTEDKTKTPPPTVVGYSSEEENTQNTSLILKEENIQNTSLIPKEENTANTSLSFKEENFSTRQNQNSPLQRGVGVADGVFSNARSCKTPPPTIVGYSSTEENLRFINYKTLPYNPKLKDKAKQLRKAGNLSEVLFWNKIKSKQLLKLDFEKQKIIGNYIVDFYCAEIDLVVEIDGESHDFKGEYDNIRDNYLRSLKLKVLHIEDIRIKKDLDNVMNEMYQLCLEFKNTPSAYGCHPSAEGN